MSLLRQLGPTLRSVRQLRARQLLAQLRHTLRGPGRPVEVAGPPPPLAVSRASTAFLRAPRHARFDGRHAIELINRRVDFAGAIDWDYRAAGPLWTYQLHQFDHARVADIDAASRRALILDWIARHREGVGWDPHPTSLRILSWGKLLLTPGALDLEAESEARVRLSLARQIETLSRNLELRLQANHLLSNLIGVVFGGMLLGGPRADRWLERAGALQRELAEQVLADGAHVERSPMYHSLLLESLLDLLNLARAAPQRAPAGLEAALADAAARMLGALSLWLHPDGEIALFSDSAFGIAQPAAELARYGAALGVAARDPERPGLLEAVGFARLEAGDFTLIASLAGPMPAHQPGHAHCDALAFELSCGAERVVTDTGVYEYVAGARREIARSTRAHATLQVGEAEQAEIWAPHRVGGRPQVAIAEFVPGQRVVASCASWSTRDSVHRRSFFVRDGAIEIDDTLEGRRRPVRLTLPLAPGLEPRLAPGPDGGSEAGLQLAGGRRMRIALPLSARWRIERTPYYPEFGLEQSRACLVGESAHFERGAWRFELLG